MTQSTYARPLVGNVLLALAFVALMVIGVITVIVPELEDDPEAEPSTTAGVVPTPTP